MPLSTCLLEEQDKVSELNQIAAGLTKKIKRLDRYYEQIEADPARFHAQANERRKELHNLPFDKRLRVLNTYYTVDDQHARILSELTSHLLAGSEGDHSAHAISLMRRALDYTCRTMRHIKRKSKRAAAVHSIEAARGAAKNGLGEITIIPTLLHDVLEEKLDIWSEKLIEQELRDPAYGDCCGKGMRDIPKPLRHKIIQKHIDDYNDAASGIYFQIALMLYDHVRYFPTPTRYHESLHSIMQIISALSRQREVSYYAYIRDLLYPKADRELDTIERDHLLSHLKHELAGPGLLLDEYLLNVHSFYSTVLSEFSSKEEVRRNAFREILAKILDRLNNTRDMDRSLGFTIPMRLYGTGFKNIFFLQALEDKFRKPSFNTEERRLIEVKFINKPKVAALYQILDDLEYVGRKHVEPGLIEFLDKEIERYRSSQDFRRLTPPKRAGYFNGLIYLFNEITLGRKSNLVELEKLPDKQTEVLIAFKAVVESFLIYPALIRDEYASLKTRNNRQASYRPYRIVGMGPGLENRSTARKEQALELFNSKTFSRRVID